MVLLSITGLVLTACGGGGEAGSAGSTARPAALTSAFARSIIAPRRLVVLGTS
jgi:hypothetical protein